MLHRKFDSHLIYASFRHKDFQDFNDWKQHALTGAQSLANWHSLHPVRKKGESLPVDAKIYGALKACLKRYFCGKCAYCESDFEAVAWGDVEHYRPKRAVTEDKGHPGYYWLAYSEFNLMPSCQLCNQGRGKVNHFPIAGKRAMGPGDDLAQEMPLLLNPYENNDCGEQACHLRYVFEESGSNLLATGRVEGLTDRGKKSVELYDLNRTSLVKRRRKSQVAAIQALRLAVITPETLAQEFKSLFDPEEEHATAIRAACREWYAHYRKQLDKAATAWRVP